jgi:hypothetical protein
MVERNAKGKQARQYFIECERKAKATAVGFIESETQGNPLIYQRVGKKSNAPKSKFTNIIY